MYFCIWAPYTLMSIPKTENQKRMPGQGRSSLDDQALFINIVSDLGDGAWPSGLFKFRVDRQD